MFERKIVLVVLGSVALLAFVAYWLRIGGELNIWFREFVYLAAPFLAVLFGGLLLKRYGYHGSQGTSFLLLVLGILSWFIGEVIWVAYEEIFFIDPFPSTADYFYLLGYPLILSSFILGISSTRLNWKLFHPATLFLFCLSAVLTGTIVSYLGIYSAYDDAVPLFENVVAISYGLGDLAILLGCLFLLVQSWEYREGAIIRLLAYLMVGFSVTLVADILFALYRTQYEWDVVLYRNVLDSFWIFSYLYIAFGFYEFAYIIREAQRKLLLKVS